MAKVAIVGGGVAGMGAAIALAKAGMQVSLFESAARLGGHCQAVSVSLWDRRTIAVDAGVSEYSQAACPHLAKLFGELNLPHAAVDRDISVMTPDQATLWFSRGGLPVFRRPSADQQDLANDIRRFGQTCHEVLEDPTYAEWSARRYLDTKQYTEEFRRLYFDPQARGWFPFADRPPDQYALQSVVSCWHMLGVVGPAAGTRMSIQGGMHAYCEAVERWLRDQQASLHLSTQVTDVGRLGSGVRLRAIDRQNANQTLLFDHVVLATHAEAVIPLLQDRVDEEDEVFVQFQSRPLRVVVHHDARLLPNDRAFWASYNFVAYESSSAGIRGSVTIYANRLQTLPASVPDVFITLNPFREPDKDKVITDQIVAIPEFGRDFAPAARRVDAMQGKRRTWFCGAYLREPFTHEQAYRSGLECAQRLIEAIADESLRFESGVSVTEGGFDAFLREVPLFADLDPRALSTVQLVARPFQLDAGATLFRQGDPPNGLYLVKHGRINIYGRVFGDDVVKLAELGRSAVVGEMGVLDHDARSASAIAGEETSGYFISRELFHVLESDFRPHAFAVMDCFRREIAKRARRVINDIAARSPERPAACPRGVSAGWPEPSSPQTIGDAILKSLPSFRTFRPTELREFTSLLKQYDFPPGRVVYAAGEPARSCLIIVRGAISMVQPNSAEAAFTVRGPGQMIGEIALLDGGPQPLDCITREPTIAFELDKVRFDSLRQGGSVLALRLFEIVTVSAVATMRKGSAHLARLSAERQVASAVNRPGHIGESALERV